MRSRLPFSLWLLERSLAVPERDAVIGDLVEEFASIAREDPRAARRWLRSQVLHSLVPNARRRYAHRHLRSPRHQGRQLMNGLATDLRFALRLMRRQRLTTVVAIASLTAGLGLNVLLFTLADAILLRPLPLHDPDGLVVVLTQRETNVNHNFSYPAYVALRDSGTLLQSLVAYSQTSASAGGSQGAASLDGEVVSGNFFEALGVPLRTGRMLTPDDDRAAAPPAAVISERLWRARYAAAPLAGQTITLNGEAFTVVGVAAGRFEGMQIGRGADFWIPLAKGSSAVGGDYLERTTTSWLTLVGRMAPAASTEAAAREADAHLRRIFEAQRRPVESLVLEPGGRGDSMLPRQLGAPLRLLMGAGLLVLLVSCVNVANLQLARIEARRLELAVRAALGARRSELVRLMLLDGALLAGVAALCSVVVAVALKDRAASLIAFFGRPVTLATNVDQRVLGAAAALAVFAAIIVGALSTWSVVHRRPAGELGDARTMSPQRRSLQRGLIVVQFALSMALLTGGGLLVRTLDRLRSTDLGFDSNHLAVVEVAPEMGRMNGAASLSYFDRALRTVSALPGVESAAVAHVMPLDFGGSRTTVHIEGYKPGPDEDMELNFLRVTAAYFDTLRIPLIQGRGFDSREASDQQPMRIVVNATMARRFWPNGGAVGRRIRFSTRQPFNIEIIGVVPDAHYRMVREDPAPSFYVSLAQMPASNGVVHVRFAGYPAARLDELRRTIASIDPLVPVLRADTLRNQIERNIADERMAGAIGVTLAAVALVLAAAGLYATMAFLVGRRSREIGVRVALGAGAVQVRAMVLREGFALVAVGIVPGVALAVWVGHALRSQLYGVNRVDVGTLIVSAVALAATALLASWIPARRAAHVDPVVALREP